METRKTGRRLTALGGLLLGLLLVTSGARTAQAQTTVITASTCDPTDFQTALSNGGLITFAADCTLVSRYEFSVSKNVFIDGTGHQVVLDGGGKAELLFVGGVRLTLNHVTVQNSSGGPAIDSETGNLIITNSAFLNNNGGNRLAGAIFAGEGSLTVLNSTFAGNQVSGQDAYGAAINVDAATAIIINTTFSGNNSPANGGAIYGRATLINTILAGNIGGNCNGTVTDGGYNLSDDNSCHFSTTGSKNNDTNINLGKLANGVIPPNASSDAIGYIPAGTNGCATTVTTDQIGQARPGSLTATCTVGAYEVVAPVTTTITDCSDDIQLQSAVSSGGRIVFACSGDIPLSKTLSINGNTALDATGQIVALDGQSKYQVLNLSEGALTLNNLAIANGNGSFVGGLFVNPEYQGAAVVTNSTFAGNTGGSSGGITDAPGGANLVVTNSTFINNRGYYGGAISASSALTVTNSTFTGNTANSGGALNFTADGIVQNSTFSGNTASHSGGAGGGAFYDTGIGSVTVENSLFSNNLGGNCAGPVSVTDGGYNLSDDKTCGFSSANSLSNNPNANPGTLSNDGGPTLTVPLLAGSIALDVIPFLSNGCGTTVLFDQRGVLRPQGTGCDIGATENTSLQTSVTFNTSPTGLSYVVGPSAYTSQQTLLLPIGTQSTLWTPSPQTATGTRYSFTSWSDNGAQAHALLIPGTSATYTGNFGASSYLLTTAASPSADGTVIVNTPSPTSDGYYLSGTMVSITANANPGYQFTSWSSNVANPASATTTVTLSGPKTVTANFAPTVPVTFGTNVPGATYAVDGTTYNSSVTLNLIINSQHTLATTSPQGTAGTQYVWQSWSDSGAISHRITVGQSAASYTATFQTQYQLTTAASPSAGGTVTPASGTYYATGSVVNLSATANAGYQFTSWTGSVANSTSASTTVTMSQPQSVTANFVQTVAVSFRTSPAGLSYTVDSTTYTGPTTLTLAVGSQHSISTTSPQGTAGTQYVWQNWSDGGTISHNITVPTSATTYTATFQTQYLLTTSAYPSTGGTVTPASGSYYASGSVVNLNATANAGYLFKNWTGSVASATSASTTVTMSQPQTVTANFSQTVAVSFGTGPAGLSYAVDGMSYTGPTTMTLVVGSTHSIATTSPQGTAGTQYAWQNWSDSGAISHSITVPASPTTYTASFQTRYQLTTAASPTVGGTVTPMSGAYYASGSVVNLSAMANVGYQFTSWTGSVASSTSASTTVTMSQPQTVTANFSATVQVTVGTSPSGLAFSVDGASYSSPQALTWVVGSTHTLATTSPQTITEQQYGFGSWSDGGAISNQVTASASTTSYTANFAALATFTITPDPPSETVYRGNLGGFILTLKSVNGFSGNVKLSCSGGPAGSYCADLPMTVPLKGTAYAISGILFPTQCTPGSYTITFTGTSGSTTSTATAQFTVK